MTPESDVVLGDRYLLNRRIAVGGMGEVWEATDQRLDRSVAVKLLREEFRTAPTFLERFRAEARHTGQLSHRSIATVYDYGETPDLAFLVMELVSGRPLSELMREEPPLSTATKLSILGQAAEGLHAAHEAGVVHRDVKPGNLMVRDDGIVKVTDFGIARALTSAPLTENGQMIGTPAYVSPEQATGEQVTGASDVYSLGVVAYELFAGRPPFERDTPLATALAHVNDPPPPLPDTVPRRVAEVIESALAKDPSLRPPTAAHFGGQMRLEMAASESAPAPVLPAPTMVQPSASRPAAGAAPALLGPMATRRRGHRRAYVLAVAFAGFVLLMGAMLWNAARPSSVDDERAVVPGASTTIAPAPATSSPTEPTTAAAPTTEPLPTEPPPTEPPAAATPPTEPPQTDPPPTESPAPVPAQPPVAAPPPAQPPSQPAPPAAASNDGGPVTESEAVGFIVDYYERVGAGDYGNTWESLSPEFRADRNLTFERYVSYWENTTLELRNPRFVAGPGTDESRVVFDARYDTGTRVVDETDEITLRRHSDGSLIITRQRTV